MNARAAQLIRRLDLKPHPEGGFYRETFRSQARVTLDQRPSRSALTTIYFLLDSGSFSAWHRVLSDEVWHWYEGESLELLLASPDFSVVHKRQLGPIVNGNEPAVTVPAHWWQAARPKGGYALCGCTVAPGFEFEDFAFLRDHADKVALLRSVAPETLVLL